MKARAPAVRPPSLRGRLAIAMAAGPVGWALDLGVGFALVPAERAVNDKLALHLLSVLGLLLAAGGAAVALVTWRGLGPAAGRARFWSSAALLSSSFFFLVVVATAVPKGAFRLWE
jgi:hypothetical protein